MREYRYEINDKKYRVRIREIYGDQVVVEVNDRTYQVTVKPSQSAASLPETDKGPQAPATAAAGPAAAGPAAAPSRPAAAPGGAVTAPMPGVILKVLVEEGDMVNAGDPVMVVEAMKMENEIKAPRSGTVKEIVVETGESVNTGDILLVISA